MSLYICGPITGLPGYNYPAFNSAAAELRALGWSVVNPAENEPPCPDPTWDDWMHISLQQVRAASLLALLPGWERSKGARLEVKTAQQLGIPVFSLKDVLAGEAG